MVEPLVCTETEARGRGRWVPETALIEPMLPQPVIREEGRPRVFGDEGREGGGGRGERRDGRSWGGVRRRGEEEGRVGRRGERGGGGRGGEEGESLGPRMPSQDNYPDTSNYSRNVLEEGVATSYVPTDAFPRLYSPRRLSPRPRTRLSRLVLRSLRPSPSSPLFGGARRICAARCGSR